METDDRFVLHFVPAGVAYYPLLDTSVNSPGFYLALAEGTNPSTSTAVATLTSQSSATSVPTLSGTTAITLTPTLTSTSTSPSSTAAENEGQTFQPSANDMSTGAKIGIGIGVALVFLAILAIGFFFFVARRRRRHGAGGSNEVRAQQFVAELNGEANFPAEMDARENRKSAVELDSIPVQEKHIVTNSRY